MPPNKEVHYANLLGVASLREHLVALYESGKNIDDISETTGIPSPTIARYLKNYGVKPCTKAESHALKRSQLSDKKCLYCNNPIPLYRQDKLTCSHRCARNLGNLTKHADLSAKHYCKLCGKEIPERRWSKQFCSNACMKKWQHIQAGHVMLTVTCPICGKEFEASQATLSRGQGKYCSRRCMNEARKTTVLNTKDIEVFIVDFYDKYKTRPTREELAALLGITPKALERRIGSLVNFYTRLGIWTDGSKALGRSSRLLFAMLDRIYGLCGVREKALPKLVNPETGSKLKLDYYVDQLKLAVEYQGEFHFKNKMKADGLSKQLHRDSVKRNYCEEHGITLVEWFYTIPVTEESVRLRFDPIIRAKVPM